jgi:1,4-dihydroxy-2-naphthoyl-CoA hydrolase
MNIWFKPFSVDDLNAYQQKTLVSHLGIHYTEVGEDFISANMPVDERTKQPAGILHGGASVALAETLGSTGANLVVNREKQLCVGLEINANHVRAMKQGQVTGVARPLHLGGTTQVWEIRISDEQDRLVCVSRITMAVLDRASMK